MPLLFMYHLGDEELDGEYAGYIPRMCGVGKGDSLRPTAYPNNELCMDRQDAWGIGFNNTESSRGGCPLT
jgi:hypothetical protein